MDSGLPDTDLKAFQSSSNYGSIGRPVPVEEEGTESTHVTLVGERLLGGSVQDKGSTAGNKCYCSSCSSCTTCYRFVLVITLVSALLSSIGFIVSEVVPRDYSRHTFIYEDTIILLDRINPLFYSAVQVHKTNDKQDHSFSVYLLSCDTAVVERELIVHNTIFTSHVNVILLPQDAMFLMEGTFVEIGYTILNSTVSSSGNSSFVISSDISTLESFKENAATHSTSSTFIAAVSGNNNISYLSYDISKTGYYYIGFSPSGNTTISIQFKISGFKYSAPNMPPACILHQSTDSCSISIPTSLAYSYDREYCLLGELASISYFVDTIYINVSFVVEHHGKWNFITILSLSCLSCTCILSAFLVTYWCYSRSKSSKKSYVLVQ